MKKKSLLLIWMGLLSPFLWAQDRYADCAGAVILCDKTDLIINQLPGPGKEPGEVGFTSCSDRMEERHSVWIKWFVAQPGDIGFNIEPFDLTDDIDFIVYRLEGDILDCSRKKEIRCMASGENIGGPEEESFPCSGRLGLSRAVSDEQEGDGCGDRHDNYLASIEAQAGECYLLYINNYSSGRGFKLEWTGSAEFSAPPGLDLPAVSRTNTSQAVFLCGQPADPFNRNDWSSGTLANTFRARVAGARVANTFGACLPKQDETINEHRTPDFEVGLPYPNPSATDTRLPVTASSPAVWRVDVFDLPGRLAWSREFVVGEGAQILDLPTAALKPGIYLIALHTHARSFVRKLVVAYK
ncbi:MAG: T9SS type A sorting domain-containing protein [Lewinellaceae bacterium]|nr:T9SS type A sorting domain-containing protein [Lewinellaceae bacterium]